VGEDAQAARDEGPAGPWGGSVGGEQNPWSDVGATAAVQPSSPSRSGSAAVPQSGSAATPQSSSATPQPSGSLQPWTTVLLSALFLVVVLVCVLALVGVPYVVLRPGPVRDTLGEQDGTPLIAVSGRPTYPTTGELNLTTVSVYGGPGRTLSLKDALIGWLSDSRTVYPRDALYPPGQTQEQAEEESQAEMTDSQAAAKAAALRELGEEVPLRYSVGQVLAGSPAEGRLQAGDVIDRVDGQAITSGDQMRALVRRHTPSEASSPVRVDVTRKGKAVRVEVVPVAADDGSAALRILLAPTYDFPFEVNIRIDDIGGPSAGVMFALGIVDKLTPGSMTGGKDVAGTGTIDAEGRVGPIGGIRQKVVGARDDGAGWFLAPAENCADRARP
jgi:PDZ domain-containing protein